MPMSYQLKISPKAMKSARFISRLQKAIQKALSESGMSQQEVATKLGVDRSVINKRLSGKANLTARSIAEFAFAFDKELNIELVEKLPKSGQNWTSGSGQVSVIQQSSSTKSSVEAVAPRRMKIESVAA